MSPSSGTAPYNWDAFVCGTLHYPYQSIYECCYPLSCLNWTVRLIVSGWQARHPAFLPYPEAWVYTLSCVFMPASKKNVYALSLINLKVPLQAHNTMCDIISEREVLLCPEQYCVSLVAITREIRVEKAQEWWQISVLNLALTHWNMGRNSLLLQKRRRNGFHSPLPRSVVLLSIT